MIKRRTTMREVAFKAGVSVYTVSTVINDSAKVAPKTRETVLEAMRTLEFEPNHAARAMKLAKSMSVTYVVSDPEQFTDSAVGVNLAGMLEALQAHGYNLVIESSLTHMDDLRRSLRQGRIDGAILSALPPGEMLEEVMSWSEPIVLFDQPSAPAGVATVFASYRGGIAAAVRHVAERGRRRLAFIGGPSVDELRVLYNVERYEGFYEGCRSMGLHADPSLIVQSDFSIQGGRTAMQRLLEGSSPDAVICATDRIAVGAVQAIQAHGLRVPEDIAVTGFNDSEFVITTNPQLTSARFPVREMGFRAAEMLVQRIEGTLQPEQERLEIPIELIVRGST
jgi:DNA-binding LacI/PurR family transcriptional regulator